MSDADEALRLSNTDKFYAKTALDRLAETYETQNETEHASAVRHLLVRLQACGTDRQPYKTEDALRWQEKMVAAQGDAPKVATILREWWAELCVVSTDPAGTLAQSVMPLIEQSVQQAVGQVLVTLHHKINAIVQDPSLSSDDMLGPEQALNRVFEFVRLGEQQLESGKPLWDNDPDLLRIAQQMQARAQAQEQPGPSGPLQ